MSELSPMMRHYVELKEKYRDCILFYRLGDFYEMFFDDAILASRELEIVLTGRDCGLPERAPMCGVPYHSAQNYIDRLIAKGYKVAICEQLSDPAKSKGLVERDVIRVVTPGTVIDTASVAENENNYLLSLCIADGRVGIAYTDVSTGAFYVGECPADDGFASVLSEVARIQPREIIYRPEDAAVIGALGTAIKDQNIFVSEYPSFLFEKAAAIDSLLRHFGVASLNGYGLSDDMPGVFAAGALIDYLKETQKNALSHINTIHYHASTSYMAIDMFTRANLELTKTLREGRVKGSLFGTLDKTKTAMGARLLKRSINEPLQNINEINERLDAVQELKDSIVRMDQVAAALDGIYDLERLITRISYGTLDARNCLALKTSLMRLPALKNALADCNSAMLRRIHNELDVMEDICALLEAAIAEDAPAGITEGGIIKTGYRADIDELKQLSHSGKQKIAELENTERQLTGIKNLKVGYNKVFGYYFEVTKSNLDMVPYRYIRKQTLTNCERFVTQELKELEEKLSGAEEKRIALEYECFLEIRQTLSDNIRRFQKSADMVALIDMLHSFAAVAYENNYVRPVMTLDGDINIIGGRHPVVESFVKQNFVRNDTHLSDDERIMILTGPNMAGKSTYMRQVALIVLMAHMGCFVPADSASICIVDKIFTRVGASDNLASGQSTFMVEMSEVANILNNATPKSLLILDEIGRGTSTLDGLSIAWSVVEYISAHIRAKTLFATHFHELSELEGVVEGVSNYSITVKEIGDTIIFLHKIVRGGTDRSFGIEVAKLAGVPADVTSRAKNIMAALESKDDSIFAHRQRATERSFCRDELLDMLDAVNLDNITPLDSLKLLSEIKHRLK